jgi:imidazole glycerol phosphate synthase glutamine amidotransferase subunit
MPLEVAIVDTGCANLASVVAAMRRLGVEPSVTDEGARTRAARCVVLPGVGAFGAAMHRVRATALDAAVRERIRFGRPLLAICLGMQLVFEESEESPGIAGIGAVVGGVSRYGPGVRAPQMGWNQVSPTPRAALLQADAMYFANSYRVERMPDGWDGATSEHGGCFVSAIERGPILACQFHPELSGAAGSALLRRWLSRAEECAPW